MRQDVTSSLMNASPPFVATQTFPLLLVWDIQRRPSPSRRRLRCGSCRQRNREPIAEHGKA